MLLALTVVVYIQENVGWGWGFGIPAISMFNSVLSFVVGDTHYVKVKPKEAPSRGSCRSSSRRSRRGRSPCRRTSACCTRTRTTTLPTTTRSSTASSCSRTHTARSIRAARGEADTSGSSSAGVPARRVPVPRFGTTFPGTRIAASTHDPGD